MMQLQPIGYPHIPPIDQAVPLGVEPVKVARPSNRWPILAGVACLALSLFLIAATIVLALIPIYTSREPAAPAQRTLTSPFLLPISSNTVLQSGALNAAQTTLLQSILQKRLDDDRKTKGSTLVVNTATAVPKTKRRKRRADSLAGSISGTYTIVYPSTVKVTSFNTLNDFTVSNESLTQLESLRTGTTTTAG